MPALSMQGNCSSGLRDILSDMSCMDQGAQVESDRLALRGTDVPASRADGSAGQDADRAHAQQRRHCTAASARLAGAAAVRSRSLGCLHHPGGALV